MKHSLVFNPVKKMLALSVIFLLMFGPLLLTTPAGADTINAKVRADTYWTFSDGNWATRYRLISENFDDDPHFPYDAFCIEDYPADTSNFLDYDLQNISMNFQKAAWIADKYYYDNTWNFSKSEVQSAIWEVLFETSTDTYSISDGNFYGVDFGSHATNINKILGLLSVANPHSGYDFSRIQMATHDASQNYIIKTPAPEPATMLLFGVGLIGLAGVIRKKSYN